MGSYTIPQGDKKKRKRSMKTLEKAKTIAPEGRGPDCLVSGRMRAERVHFEEEGMERGNLQPVPAIATTDH